MLIGSSACPGRVLTASFVSQMMFEAHGTPTLRHMLINIIGPGGTHRPQHAWRIRDSSFLLRPHSDFKPIALLFSNVRKKTKIIQEESNMRNIENLTLPT
jgi:hypothetical protein